MTVSYDQALKQAVELKHQGLTYEKIAKHLKSIGFVSERTKKPLTQMAVRYMVTAADPSVVQGTRNRKKKRAPAAKQAATSKDVKTIKTPWAKNDQKIVKAKSMPEIEDLRINQANEINFKEEVKNLLKLKNFSEPMKLKMIQALVNGEQEVTISVRELQALRSGAPQVNA